MNKKWSNNMWTMRNICKEISTINIICIIMMVIWWICPIFKMNKAQRFTIRLIKISQISQTKRKERIILNFIKNMAKNLNKEALISRLHTSSSYLSSKDWLDRVLGTNILAMPCNQCCEKTKFPNSRNKSRVIISIKIL